MTGPRTRPDHRRRAVVGVVAVACATLLAACGGGGFSDDKGSGGAASSEKGAASLDVLIASSGDAETKAVTEAADAWASKTGNKVRVQAANDMAQQLSQGFAGGNPPDVFYVDASVFGDYAKAGNLYPYFDQVDDPGDFYPNLVDTFTYDDKAYCAPKDFSTLGLIINTDSWKAAGLTDADVPTTWDQLAAVAKKLTTGDQAGLALTPSADRLGAFLVQNGGYWVDDKTGKVTATEASNEQALDYAQSLLASGVAKAPADLDAGWGGEAFGTQKAAMTIEGNWMRGAMSNDYPDVPYTVAELPAGPAGKGTLLFTQCWGISADSPNQKAAVDLVDAMTAKDQQLSFAKAYGVMPSRQSAQQQYVADFPDDAPFVAGAAYGVGPVNLPGLGPSITDLNSQLGDLKTGDIASILKSFQTNADAALQ